MRGRHACRAGRLCTSINPRLFETAPYGIVVLDAACAALTQAKRGGGDRVVIHHPEEKA
jgi:hypothetical protein